MLTFIGRRNGVKRLRVNKKKFIPCQIHMATNTLYLNDTYLFECEAVVTGVEAAENGEHRIILDQTVFYPQGGGQPTDEGTITGESGEQFVVRQVVKNRETSVISHLGSFGNLGKMSVNDKAHCNIDSERRLLNARYHMAGHLLDLALIELGVYDKWESISGNHSPEGAYVEFRPDAEASPEQVSAIVGQMENICRGLIKKDLKSCCIEVSPNSLPARSQKMLNEQMRKLPSVRINRVEGIDAYWMPCGGTLCRRLGEIKDISIPKFSFKKGLLRICYKVL
jgi:Ser-tRNA(Ala) deacylase AlaX